MTAFLASVKKAIAGGIAGAVAVTTTLFLSGDLVSNGIAKDGSAIVAGFVLGFLAVYFPTNKPAAPAAAKAPGV